MRTAWSGRPEALEHDDRSGPVVDGELDVRQHPRPVALGDEERASLAGRLDGEAVAVDEPHAGGERVDAEGLPRQVEVGERGLDDELDVARRGPARSSSTVRSATSGEPGTA